MSAVSTEVGVLKLSVAAAAIISLFHVSSFVQQRLDYLNCSYLYKQFSHGSDEISRK
jgi:hypothetical protein